MDVAIWRPLGEVAYQLKARVLHMACTLYLDFGESLFERTTKNMSF